MEISSAQIKQRLLSRGIDLVGVAEAKELILASPPRPATALMPAAKSVIVMAVAHSLGAVYSPDIMLWIRNKMQTSRLLDQVAEELGRELERRGFLPLPVSADKPVEIFKLDPETGKKFRQTRVLGHPEGGPGESENPGACRPRRKRSSRIRLERAECSPGLDNCIRTG
jgi:hypothetical protein